MPTFMDAHEGLVLPPEAIEKFRQETRDQVVDAYGVKQVELFHNADGHVYCVLDGPDEDAVRKHHAALGVECGDVHEVHALL